MKVVFVLASLSYRGAERYACLLGHTLSKRGVNVGVVAGRREKHAITIYAPVKLTSPPSFINNLIQNNFIFVIFAFPILLTLVWRATRGVDIIESESGFSLWASVIVAKLRGTKVIWTVHVCKPREHKERGIKGILLELYSRVDFFFIKKVDLARAITKEIAGCLKTFYGLERTPVMFPPVDTSRLVSPHPERVIKRFNLEGKKILLMPATLHPFKNQELAIVCLKMVLREFPQTVLLLVGDGWDRSRLKGLVEEKGLENKVIFTGVARGGEIADYYAASELVLVPSWKSEGCPITPFEALALGKLSVVANGSGADEIIKKEGIGFVASPKPEDFSKAILRYLRSPHKFESLKERGKSWVLENMNPEKVTRQNLKLYEQFLK